MRKLLFYTLLCFVLLVIPPMTAAIHSHQTSKEKKILRDWTILIGLVTRHRHVHVNGGEYVEFNAIFLHYRIHWSGNIRAGFFHDFEKIFLPSFHYGYLGSHFVAARFTMGLPPY